MQTIKRGELYAIEEEIIQFKKNSPALNILLQDKIRIFFQKNAQQFKVMHARFKGIKQKYIQQDPAGNFKTTGEDEKIKWVFIDNLDQLRAAQVLDVSQVENQFLQECETLFQQNIQINW